MRVGIALAITAFAVLAGSAASSSGQASGAPCPRGSAKGAKLGVVKVTDQKVLGRVGSQANALLAHSGDSVFVGSALCTSNTGGVEFHLQYGNGRATCVLSYDTGIALGAGKQGAIKVRLTPGILGMDFYCEGKKTLDVSTGIVRVSSSPDPLFSITGRRGALVVKVARGFVRVGKALGTPARIVGPREKLVASAGRALRAPQAIPGKQVAKLVNSPIATAPPRSVFLRPPAGKSPTLRRIFRRTTKTIVVGLDAGGGSTRGVRTFVRRYFRFLGDSWHLRAVVRPVAAKNAARLLSQRKLDLFVTPRQPARTQTLRLFPDAAGRPWFAAVSPDPVYLGSLRDFLDAALNIGQFASLYRSSFGKEPSYQVLSSQIFPPVSCVPRPDANLTDGYDLSLTETPTPSGAVPRGTRVSQTVDVKNQGPRSLDCVTLRIQVFGAPSLAALTVPSGCAPVASAEQLALGQQLFRCEVGPLAPGAHVRVAVIARLRSPQLSQQALQTCASVDADESGGITEADRSNNGSCVQILNRPALVVGAAEDAVKQPTLADAKAKLELLRLAGLNAVEMTATWTGETEALPADILELENAAAAAQLAGVRVFVVIQNAGSATTPATVDERATFAAFAAAVVRDLPSVRDFVVANEPNSNRFWLPQFSSDGSDIAAVAYEQLLAATYDAIKESRPGVNVIGGALAPRGVDQSGTDRDTHSPVAFVADLGRAYRASGRDRPIMDAFAFHPMPEAPATPPTLQHPPPSTSLGLADYDRLVALLGRAFDGTAQRGSTLPVFYTEYGIETTVPAAKAGAYTGFEPASTVGARVQAAGYGLALELAACQPNVAGVFFFHAFDEPDLDRWQSGVYYADGTPKASLAPVAAAARAARARPFASCPVQGR